MRRKQLAKRVAIAVLSAATVMTAAPVGAFAAQNVTVEAENASSVTDYDVTTATDVQKAVQTVVTTKTDWTAGTLRNKYQYETDAEYQHYVVDEIASALDSHLGGYSVSGEDVTVTQGTASVNADGQVVMPELTVVAGVKEDTTGKSYRVTFTIDANSLTDNDLLTVAKEALTAGLPKVTTWSNNTLNSDVTSAAQDILENLKDTSGKKVAMNTDGEGLIQVVNSTSNIDTAATTSAAGKISGTVNLKETYRQTSFTGKKATDPADKNDSVSFSGEIKKVQATNNDTDYQAKLEAAIKGIAFDNDDFTSASGVTSIKTTGENKIKKALKDADLYDASTSISARSFVKATKTADGSVSILFTGVRSGQNDAKHEYTVACTVKRSQADIANEVGSALNKAYNSLKADSTSVQPANAAAPAKLDDAKAAITAAIKTALGDTADDIQSFEVEVNKDQTTTPTDAVTGYKASTDKDNGEITYQVKITPLGYDKDAADSPIQPYYVALKSDKSGYEAKSTASDGAFYHLDKLAKLNGIKATSFDLEDAYYIPSTAGSKVKIAPKFTPANANSYQVAWTLETGVTDVALRNGEPETYKALGNDNSMTISGVVTNTAAEFTTSSALTPGKSYKVTAKLLDEDGQTVQTKTTKIVVKATKFNDVANPSAYYFNAVDYLSTEKPYSYDSQNQKVLNTAVINGKSDDTFAPNDDVTRAEFITMLYRQAERDAYDAGTQTSSLKKGESNSFVDVDSKAFYADAVNWAVANGVTDGKDSTHFAPNDKITRAEIVTMLNRMKDAGQTYNVKTGFVDVAAGAYYNNPVAWAYSNGITGGKDDSHFAPNDNATRAEAAVFIYRTFTGRDRLR